MRTAQRPVLHALTGMRVSKSRHRPITNTVAGNRHQTSDVRILRKEVIQPQVPLRLPCYDFTPVADPTVVGGLLAVSQPA